MTNVVGLGQVFDSLPQRGVRALEEADHIILQSDAGLCAEKITERFSHVTTLDDIYKNAEDFDRLYELGAEMIFREERAAENLCFCCFGVPDENGFVRALGRRTIVNVLAQTDPAAEAVFLSGGILHVTDYSSLSARTLGERYMDTCAAVVVTGIDDAYTASDVKIALGRFYSDDFEGVLVRNGNVQMISIENIDRQKDWFPFGVLVLPPVPLENKEHFTYPDALKVMQTLRAPDGCPWDREQTHESLRPYLIEESYEVSDAVGQGDFDALSDELGDVLLQVIFHAQLGREAGEFTDVDVTTALCSKMIRRHPHVFGNVRADTSAEVLVNWEKIKGEEKGSEDRQGILSGVPDSMDPLMRAWKLQQKAARVGFDWPSCDGAIAKAREEMDEFAEAVETNDSGQHRQEEAGDLLFAAVNALRKAGIDPQSALQDACRKFVRRFAYIEGHAPRKLEDMSLEEMDALWDEAKKKE